MVLAVGNPIMGDDGLGLAVLARLREDPRVPNGVRLVDGGTWGMNLMPEVESAARLILVDAINLGAPPGTLIRLEGKALPRYFALKLSPHQVDLKEILALAELRGTLPVTTVAIGVQPGSVDLRHGLSPAVEARVADAVQLVLEELDRWEPAAAILEAQAGHA